MAASALHWSKNPHAIILILRSALESSLPIVPRYGWRSSALHSPKKSHTSSLPRPSSSSGSSSDDRAKVGLALFQHCIDRRSAMSLASRPYPCRWAACLSCRHAALDRLSEDAASRHACALPRTSRSCSRALRGRESELASLGTGALTGACQKHNAAHARTHPRSARVPSWAGASPPIQPHPRPRPPADGSLDSKAGRGRGCRGCCHHRDVAETLPLQNLAHLSLQGLFRKILRHYLPASQQVAMLEDYRRPRGTDLPSVDLPSEPIFTVKKNSKAFFS